MWMKLNYTHFLFVLLKQLPAALCVLTLGCIWLDILTLLFLDKWKTILKVPQSKARKRAVPLCRRGLWGPSFLPATTQVKWNRASSNVLVPVFNYSVNICVCVLGRAVFQIITVPPDKEKCQYSHNNNSPNGNDHLTVFLIILHSVQFPHLWLLSGFITCMHCTCSWHMQTNFIMKCLDVTVFSEVLALSWCGSFLTTVPPESFSGLKPSTLKQLGHAVPTTTANQVNTYVWLHTQRKTSHRTAKQQS